ncbi:hypothetical protein evm_014347 [Chilo suppressalis]|nr:hypothetical protein evm_014347 [Chilo suppressalis]
MVHKKENHEGYFSTFLTHLFNVVSEKPEKDVRLLSLAMAREYNVLTKQNMYVHDFGPAFLKVLHDFSVGVAQSPADYIKGEQKAFVSVLYKRIKWPVRATRSEQRRFVACGGHRRTVCGESI